MSMNRDREQLEKLFEKRAAGYETRIRKLFSFYDAIHTAINSLFWSILGPESNLLVVGAGVQWEEVESGMRERMKTIHFVPASRIEELLAQAGFSKSKQFFRNFMIGGWVAFRD